MCTHKMEGTSRFDVHDITGGTRPAVQDQASVLPFKPMPVWERPQNNYGSNRWVVYSPKLDRIVILYSDLERDQWALAEADPTIQTFCEQPLRISVRLASGTA